MGEFIQRAMKDFSDTVQKMSDNATRPEKLFTTDTILKDSSKSASLCAILETVSVSVGFPGVGSAIGLAISFLM